MKPILYWTLARAWGKHTPIGVTSEGARGRINGRYSDGATTHTKSSRCFGRFDTLEAATARVVAIDVIRENYKEARRPLERQLSAMSRMENDEIEGLFK